jgi:hypothetical protein
MTFVHGGGHGVDADLHCGPPVFAVPAQVESKLVLFSIALPLIR